MSFYSEFRFAHVKSDINPIDEFTLFDKKFLCSHFLSEEFEAIQTSLPSWRINIHSEHRLDSILGR